MAEYLISVTQHQNEGTPWEQGHQICWPWQGQKGTSQPVHNFVRPLFRQFKLTYVYVTHLHCTGWTPLITMFLLLIWFFSRKLCDMLVFTEILQMNTSSPCISLIMCLDWSHYSPLPINVPFAEMLQNGRHVIGVRDMFLNSVYQGHA